jgi:hypothetical protein
MMAEAGGIDPADETLREYERVVDRNTWKKSERKRNSFPPSFSLASPELPSTPYEILRMGKMDQAAYFANADKGYP